MPVASWWIAIRPGTPRPVGELAAHEVAGALGRDHRDVDLRGRVDLPEVDREAVGEEQQVAGRDPVADLGLPDLGLLLVGQQDHHDVPRARGVGDVEHPQPCRLGVRAAGRVRPQPDDDVDARLLEVERVGVALRAVAEDRDGLALELREVGVVLVVDVASLVGGGATGPSADRAPARFTEPGKRPPLYLQGGPGGWVGAPGVLAGAQLARGVARQLGRELRTRFGTLNGASDAAQWRRSSSASGEAPSRGTTTATTASCHSASGRPTAAASATSGWRRRTSSTSAGITFSPPVTMTSPSRSST